MLGNAHRGDMRLVSAIHRLVRPVADVTRTTADPSDRGNTLRALREGIDTGSLTSGSCVALAGPEVK